MIEKVVIGNAELWHGDCREVLPLLMPCDLILTDPPYGIGEAAGKNKSRCKAAIARDYGNDEWDNEPPPAWVIELMRAKAKWQVLFGGNYYSLPPATCWLVWDKENGDSDFADCELAWTNLPKAVRLLRWRWAGMLQQDMANKEQREHPTQKPVPVMRWALLQAKDAATVCDPFMGSGTTGVACALEGRAFTGIERERKYFDIACERISRAQAQGQLFVETKKR
jgi:site-specific DNA-methyltransferase (adenine-specific)/modification methylase